MKLRVLFLWTFIVLTLSVKSQELWQLQPWAPDSTYVVGALPSGEPVWVPFYKILSHDSVYTDITGDTILFNHIKGFVKINKYGLEVINKDLFFTNNGSTSFYTKLVPDIDTITTIKVLATDGVGGYDWYLIDSIYTGGPDSTEINQTFGINVYEGPAQVFKIEADTLQIATLYDISQLIKGAGVVNKLAFWADSDSLTQDTDLHYNASTNALGIGTASPVGLGGTVHAHGATFSSIHLTNGTTGELSTDGSRIYTVADSLYIGNQENARIDIGTNKVTRMTITGAGRVGINTQNPSTTLHTVGEVTISSLASGGTPPTTSGTLVKVVSDANGKQSFQANNTGTVTNVGLTLGNAGTDIAVSGSPVTSSGNITLDIPTASASNRGALSSTDWTTFNNKIGGSGAATRIPFYTAVRTISSNANFVWDNTNGFMGINQASPARALHVVGNTRISTLDTDLSAPATSGTTRMVICDGNGDLSNATLPLSSLNGLTGATQTFSVTTTGIGFGITSSGTNHAFNLPYTENSTSLRLGQNADLMTNGVSIGQNAGDTDCNNCFALGMDVLRATTTGASNNVGLGFQAFYSATTAINGVSIGNYAQYFNQSGDNNIAIGESSMLNNTTGDDNVAIGRFTLRDNTVSGCVAIGNAAGRYNSTSNTLWIENSDGTTPLLGGNFSTDRIGVNTAIGTLARTFHVTGEARITDLITDTPTNIVGADADGDLGTITVGDGVAFSGGTLAAVTASHGQLYNVGNLSTQTLDGTDREIDFSTAINNNMTAVNTTTNLIEVPATGTYEISYSGSYQVASTYVTNVYFYTYVNGADSGYLGSLRSRNSENGANNLVSFSRTYITNLTAGDDIELYYDDGLSGVSTTISFFNMTLSVKRLK